ncbi:hypothetical protein CGRA01v4_08723 [Colletotrichum graminicola]|nr:hypothetical protein CGRA01v4_08723 [Colletotrichum graminicola]
MNMSISRHYLPRLPCLELLSRCGRLQWGRAFQQSPNGTESVLAPGFGFPNRHVSEEHRLLTPYTYLGI